MSASDGKLPAQRIRRIAGEALPPELAHLAEGAFGEALSRAVEFAQHSVSPRTEQLYNADWSTFRAWCTGHGAPYLPAPPSVVAAYLADRSATRGRSGLRLILAAIAHHHRRAGHLWASGDPVIASVMRGILREQKRPVRPAAALTSAELRPMLAQFDDDLAALSDRALLLIGFAVALRRSELVALDHEDIRFTKRRAGAAHQVLQGRPGRGGGRCRHRPRYQARHLPGARQACCSRTEPSSVCRVPRRSASPGSSRPACRSSCKGPASPACLAG